MQVQWVLKNLSCVCVGMLEAGDPSDAGSALVAGMCSPLRRMLHTCCDLLDADTLTAHPLLCSTLHLVTYARTTCNPTDKQSTGSYLWC